MNRLVCLIALTVAVASAQPITLKLDPAQTQIHWRVDSTLHTVHGTFRLNSGSFRFDPATQQISGTAVIDVASGDSGSHARDARMHREVLESAKYPDAVFTAERIEGGFSPPASSQELRLSGQFTIHGATHPITLMVHTQNQAGTLTATTSFDVPYVDWGMKNPGNFLLKVASTVHLEIQTVAHPAQ